MVKPHMRPIWAATLVVLTVVALFVFSGQSGAVSNAISGGMTQKILSYLPMDFTEEQSILAHFLLRKGAHLALFFLLGYGLMAIFYQYGLWRGIGLTILCSMVVAAANEYHQLLGGTRTASLEDVLLDSVGGAMGCAVCCVVHWGWSRWSTRHL